MLGTVLGSTVIVLPTVWLAYTYLPRPLKARTEHNPGLSAGAIFGICLFVLYLAAYFATSGFDFYGGRRTAIVKYLLPSIGFAFAIFPHYASRSSLHYLTYHEFGLFWLLRLMGYAMVLASVVTLSAAHG